VLKVHDTWWFCLLYCLTFGGFSGLVSYLSIFFHDQYYLTKVQSGDLTTFVVMFGSFLRPVGGVLSDRFGGYRMLLFLLTGACLSLGLIAMLPPVAIAVALLALAMAMLGMGNGSVFQLVPQRFADRVGIMTGLVGDAGGFSGFLLPSLLGFTKDATGTFGAGFLVLAAAFLTGVMALVCLRKVWVRTWPAEAVEHAGLAPASAKQPAYAISA
jgi:MFS transporter, NNP family, nitrate/nitrite transporter